MTENYSDNVIAIHSAIQFVEYAIQELEKTTFDRRQLLYVSRTMDNLQEAKRQVEYLLTFGEDLPTEEGAIDGMTTVREAVGYDRGYQGQPIWTGELAVARRPDQMDDPF